MIIVEIGGPQEAELAKYFLETYLDPLLLI